MPTTIYYFTGTGNSLAVARQLAADLGDTDLVPIPKVMNGDVPVGLLLEQLALSFRYTSWDFRK